MRLPRSLEHGAQLLRQLSPAGVRRLANAQLNDLVQREIPRARKRVAALEGRFPSAERRELGQRLIEEKKHVAGVVGGVSGVFGLFSMPADLVVMAWLELVLLVDLATLYKVNLKSAAGRTQLLDFFGEMRGVGPWARTGPRALGTVVGSLLARGGLKTMGRAVPLVAAPVSAYLNNQHLQKVGEAAVRHYEGFGRARQKAQAEGGG